MSMKRDKKDEEAGAANPFANLDKTSLLQEARAFNETPINNRKCIHILTKLLYLLGQGEQLGRTEATETFFAVTKLWQSSDPTLRRLVYLAVKELSSMADDVIIVTSSLTKDMTGREDQYRASAIRALCKITDPAMLQAIERYMKQAIVDKSPAVASAALVAILDLVSALQLMKRAPEVVKRWSNEVQEAVNSDHNMVQYHALCLLYHIRKGDRLAVNKLVQKFSKQGLKSPYAICFLIRLASKLIEESESSGSGTDAYLFDFVDSCLRHKSEMVVYEAANALTRLPNITAKELAPAVSVLQLLCGSQRPAQRFAAVRTLSKISIAHPAAVASCNMDLEQLINDSNRSIATLAITTLLKTGAEASVERLMKQISSFVTEIPDEFKIVVIQAIRSLCGRYPRKHSVMMNFLATMLRDDGGYEYKKAIVDTIINIIEENPDAREAGLSHLCEFIEDCEHAVLAVRVLQLLGREAAKTHNPRRYIRFIYNRVILEQAQVRAAAVTALARLGAAVGPLAPAVCVLLARCLTDEDDEVRDRATYYLSVLSDGDARDKQNYILGGLQYSVVGLERALHQYCDSGTHSEPFDVRSVPVTAQPISVADARPAQPAVAEQELKPKKKELAANAAATRVDLFAEQLGAVAGIAAVRPGALFRSSEPVELTEAETEYCVHCIKHTFTNHVVLQFDVRNTLTDQLLDNTRVELTPADGAEQWTVAAEIPAAGPLLPAHTVTTYCVLDIPQVVEEQTGTFNATLKFIVKDCDPNTFEPENDEGYDDEYQLEDIELGVSEHMQRAAKANFEAAWALLGDDENLSQSDDTYALSTVKTVQEAVTNLVTLFGLGVCERTDRVPDGKFAHVLLLSGKHRANGDDVMVKAKFALDPASGAIAMNMAVRSTSAEAVQLVGSVFG